MDLVDANCGVCSLLLKSGRGAVLVVVEGACLAESQLVGFRLTWGLSMCVIQR